MLSWSILRNRTDRTFSALTGIRRSEFDVLLELFTRESKKKKHQFVVVGKEERTRKTGAGQSPHLCLPEQLLFVLFYFRLYPTQDFQGALFGGTQSWACKWVHRLHPILEAALGEDIPLKRLGGTGKRIRNIEDLIERFPELSFIIDGTEQPIERPKCPKKQKSNYSGKKKKHTKKHTVVCSSPSKRIVFIGLVHPGSTHDKKMADLDIASFPEGTTLLQDTGYQGYSPPGVTKTRQPKKKKRGKKRTFKEKKHNQRVSKIRVKVEHSIGGIKRSRIAADVYRNKKQGFDDKSFRIAAGLYNFTLSQRQSPRG
jgi:hypothetical protein